VRPPFRRLTVEFYTQGDCGDLAVRLHELTGWPLAGNVDGDGAMFAKYLQATRGWSHAMVRTPEGLYLDVTGARTAHDVKKHWLGQRVHRPEGGEHGMALRELRDVWQTPFYREPSARRRARTLRVAQRVLTLYAQRPVAQDFVPVSWWTNNHEFIGMDDDRPRVHYTPLPRLRCEGAIRDILRDERQPATL
jgi:hypothetical protein